MNKTGLEIEKDVFAIINASELKATIGGTIYKDGLRPVNAKTEDAVIKFVTGLNGQSQVGVVVVNVFVPNIEIGDATLVKNITRCRTIEALMSSIVLGADSSEYDFSLGSMIQTFQVDGIEQHFVNAKIRFKRSSI
jgi:hypothetical protein